MQQNVCSFIVSPDQIEEIFSEFTHRNPFSYKKEYKDYKKNFRSMSDNEFEGLLSNELQAAYKNAKPGDYIYHNDKKFKVAILKFRKKDDISNSGKSGGWRLIALVDEINKVLYLLSIYKHSKGKNDLTPEENKKVRLLCDEYVNSI